ncbi:MAG TPA: hypothetical protein VFD15_06665, partial [Clostridia bacterium]|nr:hypothetical protein [Clostridia bacterium]
MMQGFALGVLTVLILAAGVYFFWQRKLNAEEKPAGFFADELSNIQNVEPNELEIRISNIESKVEAIYVTINQLSRQVDALATRGDSDTGINPKYIEIYNAYDRGTAITEIARSTGRNKGEI